MLVRGKKEDTLYFVPVLAIAASVFENSKRYNGKRNMGNLAIVLNKNKSMIQKS
jgi:hypothetical protein